jgi:hypothetical protein
MEFTIAFLRVVEKGVRSDRGVVETAFLLYLHVRSRTQLETSPKRTKGVAKIARGNFGTHSVVAKAQSSLLLGTAVDITGLSTQISTKQSLDLGCLACVWYCKGFCGGGSNLRTCWISP